MEILYQHLSRCIPGLGTTTFGWTADRNTSFRILNTYFKLEGRVLDTADSYPQWNKEAKAGDSEVLIGEFIKKNFRSREELFLISKYGKRNNYDNFKYDEVVQSCYQSLDRLNTDYLDCYVLHTLKDATTFEETVWAFCDLYESGLIRSIGFSNLSRNQIIEFYNKLPKQYWARVGINQYHYNLVERDSNLYPYDDYSKKSNLGFETEIAPVVNHENTKSLTLAYHGIARGFLTDRSDNSSSVHLDRTLKYKNDYRAKAILELLRVMSLENATNIESIALGWLFSRNVLPLVSARNSNQIVPLMRVQQITQDALRRIDSVSKPSRKSDP